MIGKHISEQVATALVAQGFTARRGEFSNRQAKALARRDCDTCAFNGEKVDNARCNACLPSLAGFSAYEQAGDVARWL